MIEDITFVATEADRCLLRWEVHLDSAALLRPVEKAVVAKVFAPMVDRCAGGLAHYAESTVL